MGAKMRTLTLLLTMTVVLSGCETVPPSGYYKEGGTYKDFMSDRFECLKVAANAYCMNVPLYNACMEQLGWAQNMPNGFHPQSGWIRGCK